MVDEAGNPLPTKNDVDQGYIDLAKQLTKMADSLPLIKACMADVKSGAYTNTAAGLTAAGATAAPATDPQTGKPVQVVV